VFIPFSPPCRIPAPPGGGLPEVCVPRGRLRARGAPSRRRSSHRSGPTRASSIGDRGHILPGFRLVAPIQSAAIQWPRRSARRVGSRSMSRGRHLGSEGSASDREQRTSNPFRSHSASGSAILRWCRARPVWSRSDLDSARSPRNPLRQPARTQPATIGSDSTQKARTASARYARGRLQCWACGTGSPYSTSLRRHGRSPRHRPDQQVESRQPMRTPSARESLTSNLPPPSHRTPTSSEGREAGGELLGTGTDCSSSLLPASHPSSR